LERRSKVATPKTFKEELLTTVNPLVWTYDSVIDFERKLQLHLFGVAVDLGGERLQRREDDPRSLLSFAARATETLVRSEGHTELMGELILTCTYDGDVSPTYPMAFDVALAASAPITSRISSSSANLNTFHIVLCDAGRPGGSVALSEVIPLSPNATVFREVRLEGIQPRQTRTFRIANLRCNAAGAGPDKIYVYLSVTGSHVDRAQWCVARHRPGMKFEIRSSDSSAVLPDDGVHIGDGSILTEQRLANLRFVEGFPNSFKSRAAESDRFGFFFASDDGSVEISGLADTGTILLTTFDGVPPDTTIFVPVCDVGSSTYSGLGRCARLIGWVVCSSG
jgi:hypothetical protein